MRQVSVCLQLHGFLSYFRLLGMNILCLKRSTVFSAIFFIKLSNMQVLKTDQLI